MKLSQMKLSFLLCAPLMVLGVIPSSLSLAQSGWFWQNPLPQGNLLCGVFFVGANTGTAVGGIPPLFGGTILRTTTGGVNLP